MEPWQDNNQQVGRLRVAIARWRRRRRCGWCGRCRAELGTDHGTVRRVGDQLGFGVESVRKWVRRADIDDGAVAGTTTADRARIKVLESENRELRRANAILKSASAFFAAELDGPLR